MITLRRGLALTLVALAASGCQHCGETLTPVGVLAASVEHGGVQTEGSASSPLAVDFGDVAMGAVVHRTVVVENKGPGPLVIEALGKVEGDAVRLGTSLSEQNPLFILEGAPGLTLEAGARVSLELTYAPPVDTTRPVAPHRATVTIRASGTERTADTMRVELSGRGVGPDCFLPTVLDFGAVARGDSFMLEVPLRNSRATDDSGFLDAIRSAQTGAPFSLAAGTSPGEVAVPANSERRLGFVFSPTEARDFFATVTLRAAQGCPAVTVSLRGTGVDQVLTWSPSTVDFFYADPGITVRRELTFSNQGLRPVVLRSLQPFEGTVVSTLYRVTEADPSDLTTRTVPGAGRDVSGALQPGTATVTLAFTPDREGPVGGVLRADTDLGVQTAIAVPLSGAGGGPDIELQPASTLDLGRIASFAGAQGVFRTSRVLVRNVGFNRPALDPEAALRLGVDGAGAPYWTVRATNPNATASELCVGAFDEATGTCTNTLPLAVYDPAVGLVAQAPRPAAAIPVRFTPASVGPKSWELTLYSNDADEPEVRLAITAEAVVLPSCSFTVTPSGHAFGVLTPPTPEEVVVQVRNTGTTAQDTCLLGNIGLASGSDDTFTLPGGPVLEKALLPGETYSLVVRADVIGPLAPSATTAAGRLVFQVSNPTQPQVSVPLSATLAPTCLVATPRRVDFGPVALGCTSATRTVSLLNVCAQPLSLRGLSIRQAAASEFSITTAPPLPGGTLTLAAGGAAVPVQVTYRPVNTGRDDGALVLEVLQAGQAVTYLVQLRGEGATVGAQTDRFPTAAAPKLDVLVVLDDSCSMQLGQLGVPGNFASFFGFLQASGADFQAGVVTTTDPRVRATATGTKQVRRTTPQAASEFAALTALTGGNRSESCLDNAGRALTGSHIADPATNRGLVRPDAALAVVCVSDQGDQTVTPVSTHVATFHSVKGVTRPGLFTFNVVGPFAPTACAVGLDLLGRYGLTAAATGGLTESLCLPDWATAMQGLNDGLLTGTTRFVLSQVPDLTGGKVLDVRQGGLPVPQTSGAATVWTWSPVDNSVELNPLFRPPPGAELTIGYAVPCY